MTRLVEAQRDARQRHGEEFMRVWVHGFTADTEGPRYERTSFAVWDTHNKSQVGFMARKTRGRREETTPKAPRATAPISKRYLRHRDL